MVEVLVSRKSEDGKSCSGKLIILDFHPDIFFIGSDSSYNRERGPHHLSDRLQEVYRYRQPGEEFGICSLFHGIYQDGYGRRVVVGENWVQIYPPHN